jgi:hypothetical protein
MTTSETTPPQLPTPPTPQPAPPPQPSQALTWTQLAVCTTSVIAGTIIGLTHSTELGSTLAGAGLSGIGIRIAINIRR